MGLGKWLRRMIGEGRDLPPAARPEAGLKRRPDDFAALASPLFPAAPSQAETERAPARRVLKGRPSRLPRPTDPQTQQIDQAMVLAGLLSEPQLEAIHAAAAAPPASRTDALQPATQARGRKPTAAQKAAEKSARQARRAQQQAAAEGRRRARQQEVAHRRATDIIYLGPGVSAGLADRKSDVDKLAAAGLPVLSDPASVAEAMGLSIPKLRWLAFHSEAPTRTHYVRFTVPKKSGGVRELWAPHEQLAAAQAWIGQHILARVSVHDAAHGFVPRRSTLTNAQPHLRQQYVLGADLMDFFPTITFPRVRGLFMTLGYSPAAATILALLCTESPRTVMELDGTCYFAASGPRALPQGACTSPAISNLIAWKLDCRLAGLARTLGWQYTRYADDLTFSTSAADQAAKLGYLLTRIRHIAQDEGFRLNGKKTRIARPSGRQQVTGVVVNERPGVPRPLVRRIRAILHQAQHTGLAAQNRAGVPHFEAWLRGMVAYIHAINPEQARPLRTALDALTLR